MTSTRTPKLTNMQANLFYGLACLLVAITVYLTVNLVIPKFDNVQEAKKLVESKNTNENQYQVLTHEKALPSLSITDYSLPAPPYNPSIQSMPNETVNKATSKVSFKLDKQLASEKEIKLTESINISEEEKSLAVQKHLDDFVKLSGQSRELYFASSSANKQSRVIEYMHDCIGIGLAAYNGQQLTMLSAQNVEHVSSHGYSKVLRQVNGFKSEYETALLNTYAPNQQLIRLYPKWLDLRLANYIYQVLGNEQLTQFKGSYVLQNDKLLLTNIIINHHNVSGSWILMDVCNGNATSPI